ncbi:MAG: RNA methyltransferase [Betaproteobacteria bacterium]|nr:RNA methyltransferase [Betaproteobacteria bacterium]
MKRINSRSNPLYKSLAKLKDSPRERRADKSALLDGAHLISAYLDRIGAPRAVAVADAAQQDPAIRALLARTAALEPIVLADGLFRELSPVTTPTGILAVVEIPAPKAVPRDIACCLLLEDIQDPGNLGGILRSAAAAGLEHVLLSRGCADAWSPRVLRGAMGAHFLLNIVERAELVVFAEAYAGQVVATAARAGRSVFETDLRPATAFAVGNEGAGLTHGLAAQADAEVAIPMPGRMESINVAAAVAVCLFERVRQRTAAGDKLS